MVVEILTTTFSALSDPTRRAIVERLSRKPASVRELTEPFELSQQAISKHLVYLIRARIVKKEKVGRESICTLQPGSLKAVSDWAANYRRFWEESFHKMDDVLEEMKRERKNGKKQKPRG
jgi:DNA-binding transcriptional ArsR family regulator